MATTTLVSTLRAVEREARVLRLRSRAKEARTIQALLSLRGDDDNEDDIEVLEQRLGELEAELVREEPPRAPTVNPALDITVAQCSTMEDVCARLRAEFPVTVQIRDAIVSASPRTVTHNNRDTRHQDAKDCERDQLVLVGGGGGGGASSGEGDLVLVGAGLGYEAVVDAVAAYVLATIKNHGDSSSQTSASPESLRRFARVLINATNRTSSGGDAYEALERFVRPVELCFIAPDSQGGLEPMRIACTVTTMKLEQGGWDFGVRARTEAETRYLMFANEDVDRPVAKLRVRCVREFGLALPLPGYPERRVFDDDGQSLANRDFFELDHGGFLHMESDVLLL